MHSFAWWPTVVVVLVAAFTDLRSRRIPNWLVIPFLLLGIVVSVCLNGWHGLGQSFAGLGLALLIFGFLFWIGGMGAGDVKLLAAIGAWVGPKQLLFALFYTSLAGGVMVLCWAVFGGFLWELFTGSSNVLFAWRKSDKAEKLPQLSDPKARKMPYAPAIAIGTLLSFFTH